MKVLTKEHLIEAINANYKTGELISASEISRQIDRLGDDYYRIDGEWKLTNKANVNWQDKEKREE